MGEILITFIKQSSAYKLAKTARRYQIGAKVVQTPKELSIGGCSYGVLARRADMHLLLNICHNNGVEYKKVFAIYTDDGGKKIYSEV